LETKSIIGAMVKTTTSITSDAPGEQEDVLPAESVGAVVTLATDVFTDTIMHVVDFGELGIWGLYNCEFTYISG
jgi:hypothetical protein